MKNSLRILLVLGVIMGLLPIIVWADPIIDADVSIKFIIDDGNPEDSHDKNGWLVAGGGASSTIRANYTGNVSPQINYVKFTSDEGGVYGSVMGYYVGSLPYYDGIFTASENRAGNASIDLHINYSENGAGYDYFRTVYQQIDHATPKKIQSIAFESEVTIDKMMNITMTMEDTYGNPVTSLYENEINATAENVTFETTRYACSGFYDGDGCDGELVTIPVNAEGTVVATFKAGTEAGPKYLIHVVPNVAENDKWLTITALGDAEPYAIDLSVRQNDGETPPIPADGESKFHLTCSLFDRYHNPSGNQAVKFTDNIGDVFTRRTNSDGQIMFTFGPFDTAATFTINATAVENSSVTIDREVRFTNTSPEDMLLTANPQSMPSADVQDAEGADILAKVIDESGNGVSGERVDFWILNKMGIYCEAQMAEPTLDAFNASTNADGIAKVHFTPGWFVGTDDDSYIPNALGSCMVFAEWIEGEKMRSIDLEWKNYPYLRVETEVSQETVDVGDSVDVTVRLIGDGWALYSKSIDVMLCADRSESMDDLSKMGALKVALKDCNKNVTGGRNRVGMVFFGGDATRDLNFTIDKEEVDCAINNLDLDGSTPMHKGLYLAIKEIIENPGEGAVKAVILMSDGEYNTSGDPLAGRSKYYENYSEFLPEFQNLSVYAASKNILIYPIGFKNDDITVLRMLAKSTCGKYYSAPTGDDLAEIYTSIARELKDVAGVNTEMGMIFNEIEVDNEIYQNNLSYPILEYEYEENVSTHVKTWIGSGESLNIIRKETLDQTKEWGENRHLSFDSTKIGNIQLGQTWQAKFRLTAMKPGNINIFGEGSSISFNDGEGLALPKTYITALDNLNATCIDFTGLRVHDLFCEEYVGYEGGTTCPVIENDLTVDWNLSYSGNDTVTQCLYYEKVDDGFRTQFCTFDETDPANEKLYKKQLYVADFPPGEYKIRVHAMADDAPDSVVETNVISIGRGVGNYILLE